MESSRKLPEGRDQLPARDRSFLTKMTENVVLKLQTIFETKVLVEV